ncbi:MAG TPA: hypothetical protein VG297_17550 [Bryobacteraceae bacterium]|nr:hypothetical protein [Bryobacteraceae bacterium]
MPVRTTRSEKLDIRLTHNARRALQVAAAASHRSCWRASWRVPMSLSI